MAFLGVLQLLFRYVGIETVKKECDKVFTSYTSISLPADEARKKKKKKEISFFVEFLELKDNKREKNEQTVINNSKVDLFVSRKLNPKHFTL